MNKLYFLLIIIISAVIAYKFDTFGIDKKSKLNTFYSEELRIACSAEINPETQKWGENRLDVIENNMLQDGYDRAQIKDLRNEAFNKAYDQRTKLKNYHKKQNRQSIQ